MTAHSLFHAIEEAPKDPILGISELFNADTRSTRVNLAVGVYQNSEGKAQKLKTVQKAEEIILKELSATYLPIDGIKDFNALSQRLVFGVDSPLVKNGSIVTAQTPGGTGALKVGADFLGRFSRSSEVWISDPTWDNHRALFEGAGFKVHTYPYWDGKTRGLNASGFLSCINNLPAKSILVLHACCHNPTGVDLTSDQWLEVRDICLKRELIPFLDFAYQGLGTGLEEDAFAVRLFAETGTQFLVANSFSKSFGLYCERTGSLSIVTESADEAKRVVSQVKRLVRGNYSNPPAHGGKIVSTILSQAPLRAEWEGEVAAMRNRILEMRDLFASTLKSMNVEGDFDFIRKQRGMFSYTGLSVDNVRWLRNERAIYLVESGRICVAALNKSNIEYVCTGIRDALKAVG